LLDTTGVSAFLYSTRIVAEGGVLIASGDDRNLTAMMRLKTPSLGNCSYFYVFK
jgi:hypothetical protein